MNTRDERIRNDLNDTLTRAGVDVRNLTIESVDGQLIPTARLTQRYLLPGPGRADGLSVAVVVQTREACRGSRSAGARRFPNED